MGAPILESEKQEFEKSVLEFGKEVLLGGDRRTRGKSLAAIFDKSPEEFVKYVGKEMAPIDAKGLVNRRSTYLSKKLGDRSCWEDCIIL